MALWELCTRRQKSGVTRNFAYPDEHWGSGIWTDIPDECCSGVCIGACVELWVLGFCVVRVVDCKTDLCEKRSGEGEGIKGRWVQIG